MRPKKEHYKKLGLKMNIEEKNITNLKEIHSLKTLKSVDNIQEDLFDKIRNQLFEIMTSEKMRYYELRENLYDLLIYNLDVQEVIMSILFEMVDNGQIKNGSLRKILDKMPLLLKQYNNNYRPIYHLENIFLTITNELCN